MNWEEKEHWIGISTDAYACGMWGLAFLGGGYMPEAFRSGMESIGKIQEESALSLGFSKVQTFRYVLLPQAASISVPALVANVVFLLKETSVFSAISLMDLMFTAKDLIGIYYKTTESLFLLVVFYLIILFGDIHFLLYHLLATQHDGQTTRKEVELRWDSHC